MAYVISTIEPTKGFHPTSTSIIYLPPPSSLYQSCLLYLYFTLPPLVFVDTHELSQRGAHYQFSHWGSRDLEKPVHALAYEPSEILINVEIPEAREWDEFNGEQVVVEVPMHLRYGTPRSTRSKHETSVDKNESYERIQIDWPMAFFLCPSTSQSSFFLCMEGSDENSFFYSLSHSEIVSSFSPRPYLCRPSFRKPSNKNSNPYPTSSSRP